MAHRLETCQILQFEEAFDLFDRNKDGLVSVLDLPSLMCLLGYTPTTEELAQLVATSFEEGRVNIMEFLDMMSERVVLMEKEKELMKTFRLYDKNDTGYITVVQMHILLHEFHGLLSDEELETFTNGKELKETGKLKYEPLFKALAKRLPSS